jgi:hypothetical protein
VFYEYPTRYAAKIQTGTAFVYYRGRRTTTGPPLRPAYLGIGIVGRIQPSGEGRLRCTVADYRPFPEPVDFKHGDLYREPRANAATAVGFFFQVGVRDIDDQAYAAIVSAGLGDGDQSARSPAPDDLADDGDPRGRRYPDSGLAQEVDAVAMTLAVDHARELFPSADVVAMPHNNPGFDVLIRDSHGPATHIEVKGTVSRTPRFFLSEGERLFSERHAHAYELWVFHSIDLVSHTGILRRRPGSLIDAVDVTLAPVQWAGWLETGR